MLLFILPKGSKNWSKQKGPRAGLLALFLAPRQLNRGAGLPYSPLPSPCCASPGSTAIVPLYHLCPVFSRCTPSTPECQEQQGFKCLCWQTMTFQSHCPKEWSAFLGHNGSSNSCNFSAQLWLSKAKVFSDPIEMTSSCSEVHDICSDGKTLQRS